MNQVVALAKGKYGAEHCVAHAEALALARAGRLQAARLSSNRAVDLALQEGQRETAASYRAARAVWEAVYGNAAEGKRSATEALELSKGREVQYAAGLPLAFFGESSRSEALAGDLEKRFPEDAFVKFTYAPHSATRKALEIVRSEYSAITEHEWKLLLHELRLSQRVLGQSRYAAYLFTKP